MTPRTHEETQLLELLVRHAFERRRVVLSSGRESDFYIDCKRVSLLAEGHWLIGRAFLARCPEEARGVGGLTLGADPLASAVAVASYEARRPLDAFLVRKEPKRHGTQQWVEAPAGLGPGAKVVIVEDVITTGASTIRAIERARLAGFEPLLALALVDRLEGGRQAIEETGVPVEALFDRGDFLPEEGR